MPSRPWLQIATNYKLRRQGFLSCRNLWLSLLRPFQNTTSQIDIKRTRGYTPKYRKHVHIHIGQFQEGFLVTSFMDLITDIHTHRYTIEKTPKWAKNELFIFMSKVNLGTLPSTQNTFSVLLDSVCAVTASITNCDGKDSWIVAICDGSKQKFSNRFHSNRGYTPNCRKHVHVNIGPYKEGFLGTSIMGFITDIYTHKQIYQWNNTKMGKIQLFIFMSKVNLGTLPST